jgi:hypothetical protein
MSDNLAERFLPIYDVSDAVARVVETDRETCWQALLDVDLVQLGHDAPLVGVLGAVRAAPELVAGLVHGRLPSKPPKSLTLRDLPTLPMSQGGWILLGERPGEELALGLVGKFWRPVIEYAQISSPEEFQRFDEPGFGKTVYDLSATPLSEGRTLLSGLMRTTTTDDHSRRWFRRYWTLGVGAGAHVLAGSLLDAAAARATGCRDVADIAVEDSESAMSRTLFGSAV